MKIKNLLAPLTLHMPWKKTKPLTLCIDTTYRCNLKCKHCYFLKKKYKNELSNEEWIRKIRKLNRIYNFLLCSWIGGEPLLRRSLVKKGIKYFPFNWVVTNGMFEIPKWRNTIFFVSVDGTKNYHEWLRGKNTYTIVKNNILNSKAEIFLAMTINRRNHSCLEKFVREWSTTNVKGIGFSFHSPLKAKDELFIPPKKRDIVLERILKLKREYPDFIILTRRIIELMKSYNYKKVVGRNCIIRTISICLNPEGNVKNPCLFESIKCEECGCSIPYGVYAFFQKDLETAKLGLRLIKPKISSLKKIMKLFLT